PLSLHESRPSLCAEGDGDESDRRIRGSAETRATPRRRCECGRLDRRAVARAARDAQLAVVVRVMLKVGDSAPDFIAPSHTGSPLALRSFRGRKVLLWFFPEADTPGCSLEGRGFRDHQEYFDDNGIAIVGISFDPIDRNAAFAEKHHFEF